MIDDKKKKKKRSFIDKRRITVDTVRAQWLIQWRSKRGVCSPKRFKILHLLSFCWEKKTEGGWQFRKVNEFDALEEQLAPFESRILHQK